MSGSDRIWYTYIVRCADNSLYTGYTVDDLAARIRAHNEGRGARYTKARRPVILIWHQEFSDAHDARSLEAKIKRLSRKEKEELVRGNAEVVLGSSGIGDAKLTSDRDEEQG